MSSKFPLGAPGRALGSFPGMQHDEAGAGGGKGERIGRKALASGFGMSGVLGSGWASSDGKSSAFRGRRQTGASVDGGILLFPPQNDTEQQVLGE